MFFKKNRDTIIFGAALLAFTSYVLLDTFLIPHPYETASQDVNAQAVTESEYVAESGNTEEETDENSAASSKQENQENGGKRSGRHKHSSSDSSDDASGSDSEGSSQSTKPGKRKSKRSGQNSDSSGTISDNSDDKKDLSDSSSGSSDQASSSSSSTSDSPNQTSSSDSSNTESSNQTSSSSSSTSDSSNQASSSSSSTSDSSNQASGSSNSASKKSNRNSKSKKSESNSDTETTTQSLNLSGASIIDTYQNANAAITLYEYRAEDTEIYVADVVLQQADALQTAFAEQTYGKNVTAKTSEIASEQNAVLAINGDFYGAREKGYVIRNGVLYRDTSAGDQEDLVIYADGSVQVINESSVTADTLIENGAMQVFSFGPALLQNGQVAVSADAEVGKAMASNPRTAIGIVDSLHYVFVVSDGRTQDSEGLSLSELATFMQNLGVTTAYNLDGGGSSTMYFNGNVINNPTTSGRSIKERSVSDIVYIQ